MRENITALYLLYVRPVAAISRILDRGRMWFAVGAAVLVSMMLRMWLMEVRVGGPLAARTFASWIGFSSLAPLVAIVVVFVPAVILLRAVSGFGSFSVLMRSDYLSLLLCVLMAWSAAYLPFVLLGVLFGPALLIPANIYFMVLAAFGVRTVFGIGFGRAFGWTLVGCGAAMGGIALSDLAGPLKYYAMSPFLLYYAYMMFGSDVRSLGEGLRSRQHFQRQLEIATSNPRDADAHYQLGLIYQKRRQYSEAIARFQRAIEIDPTEADAQFQLGRIARQQSRYDDAIRYLSAAAGLNDKLASSEVWRELGAAYFGASRFEEAAAALAKYTARRAYDPEGQYWHGKALATLGRSAEAREAFRTCVDAVDTMPRHRRAEVRQWKGLARKELANLRS
ncbi:MAG TPA: tetratricopeptide repeat protein [Bryobacteraceae bacterium]|nr:tetratricopeptide repeat protein [Bryobacteraceae bacterium]